MTEDYEKYQKYVDYVDTYRKASNAATGSAVDANANVETKNVTTLSSEMFKPEEIGVCRKMMTDKLKDLYGPDIAEQYLADLKHHIIYKHDETHSQLPYCASITLYPFLHDGLSKLGGISSAPKNLEAFCGSFINLVFAVAAQLAGAVATPEWLCYLDYFIRKKYGDDYISRADELVDLSKNGRTIDKVITDCFEQTVYSLNQPAAARGYQATFWNVAYFDRPYFEEIFRDFVFPDGDEPKWETVSWLQKRFMKWFNAERLRKPLTFPVETVNLLNDGKNFVDQEWADFAADMYAEGHSFFTYTSSSVDALASCCYTDDTKVIVKIGEEVVVKPFRKLQRLANGKDGFMIYCNGEWKHGKLVELPRRPIYSVKLANGMKMKLTDNHRNNCYRGMKHTDELTVSDYIMVASKGEPGFISDNPLVSEIIKGGKVVFPNKKDADKVVVDCIRAGIAVKKDIRATGSVVLQRYNWSYLHVEKHPDEFVRDDGDNLYFRVTEIKQIDYASNVFCFEMDDKDDDKFTLANGIHNYNCRLRNGLQNNVFSYTLGAGGISTGSKCVITLNINRIVQDATRDGKDLSGAIKDVVKRVHKYLTAYNEMIKDNLNSGLLPLYDAGFIDMKRQYLTVGFNGLVEAAEFLGIDVAVNDDYKKFTNEILKPIYELNQEDRTEELMFNTEYVPSLIRGDCAA